MNQSKKLFFQVDQACKNQTTWTHVAAEKSCSNIVLTQTK
jgi:hypothetical protein